MGGAGAPPPPGYASAATWPLKKVFSLETANIGGFPTAHAVIYVGKDLAPRQS